MQVSYSHGLPESAALTEESGMLESMRQTGIGKDLGSNGSIERNKGTASVDMDYTKTGFLRLPSGQRAVRAVSC